MKKIIKYIGIVIAGFFVLAVLIVIINPAGKTEKDGDGAQTAPREEVIKVSAVRLSEEYDANKVAADSKYKGKILEISGIIKDIGKDILDTPYVSLQGRQLSLFGVQCMFARADESKLATLSKGQSIVLQGRVEGELIGNIVVRGCSIIGK